MMMDTKDKRLCRRALNLLEATTVIDNATAELLLERINGKEKDTDRNIPSQHDGETGDNVPDRKGYTVIN